jgi:hypothetical protein
VRDHLYRATRDFFSNPELELCHLQSVPRIAQLLNHQENLYVPNRPSVVCEFFFFQKEKKDLLDFVTPLIDHSLFAAPIELLGCIPCATELFKVLFEQIPWKELSYRLTKEEATWEG